MSFNQNGDLFTQLCLCPFFSALLYMFFQLLNMTMLNELSDHLRLMDIGICFMVEGVWFEEVCI